MKTSRRNFLVGIGLPAAGLAATGQSGSPRPLAPLRAQATPGGLQFRTLGKTKLKVTAVSFGCMITSDGSVLERAVDAGINYFDTARGYQGGNNERMVGAALKSRRKDLVLSSKTGARTKDAALADLNTSLQTLGTDYLDIWYLHAKSRGDQLTDDLLEAQRIAKQDGKIRFAGFSTHGGQPDVIPAGIQCGAIDVILTAYNFTLDAGMDALIESAAKAGVGVVAMKVMAGGFRRVQPGTPAYNTLKREGALLAALKWVLRNPNIGAAIPSMTDADQLEENLKAMSAGFSDEDGKTLAAQMEYIRPLYCRMCGECDGQCPRGMPVADVLRYLTYAEGYGQFALGRSQFLELPAAVAQVRCDLCPSCSVSCPYGVRVAERLMRAQELFA